LWRDPVFWPPENDCKHAELHLEATGNGSSKPKVSPAARASDSGARRVVDHICEGRPAFWGTAADQIDRAEFARRLLASDRTERSLFELLMALYAGGKPILGEKSPHHIHYVPTLLEWFPQAKVIHTLRDLRAIFVSQRQKKSKQENVPRRHRLFRNSALSYEVYMGLNISIHWLRLAQLHHQYRQCYPNNYYLCRFEDLVTDPERHLRKLCTFLDIDFNQAMLQQSFQNSSLTERHQAQGFDALATARWRQHLHPLTNKWLIWWSKKQLTEFGYPL
jgi:hypothetical protein